MAFSFSELLGTDNRDARQARANTRRLRATGVAALFTTIAVLVTMTTSATAAEPDTRLVLSLNPDRTDVRPLDEADVHGNIYVVVRPSGIVEKVDFFLDGNKIRTENDSPFDLAGTATDWSANPFDVSQLTNGRHTINARVTKIDGRVERLTADFSVSGGIAKSTTTTTKKPATTSTTVAPTTTTTSTTTTTTMPPLKPTASGLIDRKGAPDSSVTSIVDTYVVNVGWGELQSSAGSPILSDNPVDRALTAVRAQNAAGANVRIKIRYVERTEQPLWVQNLGGAPVEIHDPVDGNVVSVGRFWTPEFGAAYADLQARMAAKYDKASEIVDVTIGRCTTVYAEPFIRQIADSFNRTSLLAAGYTHELDTKCHREQIEAHNVWTTTRSSLAANPFQYINPNGSVGTSVEETIAMLQYCRATLTNRCVLENNSLRESYLTGTGEYQQMYAAMLAMGGAITFQTATPTKVGNLAAVLEWASVNGVTGVELPAGYSTMVSAEQLKDFDQRISAHASTLSNVPAITN